MGKVQIAIRQSHSPTSGGNNLDLSGYDNQTGLNTKKLCSDLLQVHRTLNVFEFVPLFVVHFPGRAQSSPVQSCESASLLCTSLSASSERQS